MIVRRGRFTIGFLITGCFLSAGCEQKPASPPAAPSPSASSGSTESPPSPTDLAALRSLVVGDNVRAPQGLPAGHPPIPSSAVPREPSKPGRSAGVPSDVKFDSPIGWKPQTPRSTMRKAQYILPRTEGDAEDAELVVYYFGPGEGGNVTDNLDRWRSQFTQADGSPLPDDAAKQESFETNGLKVTLLETAGRYTPGPGTADTNPRGGFRMYAAVIETTGGPWFVKATGPARTMEHQREAVRTFLSSAKP